jgi:hypothetical protein
MQQPETIFLFSFYPSKVDVIFKIIIRLKFNSGLSQSQWLFLKSIQLYEYKKRTKKKKKVSSINLLIY